RDYGLVDIVGGLATLVLLTLFLKVWKPAENWHFPEEPPPTLKPRQFSLGRIIHAWTGFLLLAVLVIVWGVPSIAGILNRTMAHGPFPVSTNWSSACRLSSQRLIPSRPSSMEHGSQEPAPPPSSPASSRGPFSGSVWRRPSASFSAPAIACDTACWPL